MLTLPLFPLGTVLLPGLLLPLHVFEERYRALVRDLLGLPEGEPRRFGVVAIRSGFEVGTGAVPELYDVGCTAELRQVEALDDGRFAVATVGVQRFALRQVTPARRPYLLGEVELLPDDRGVGAGGEAERLAGQLRVAFAAYQQALAEVGGRLPAGRAAVDVPDDPVELSYLVAAAAVVDLDDTQALLAAPSAADRLRAELALLRRELGLLRRVPGVPAPELTRVPQSPN